MDSSDETTPAVCPVCGRTDPLPIRHGLQADRRFGREVDGVWWSGIDMGPTRERWRCRGCGCQWPPSMFRFHVFVDVYARDHATAKAAVEQVLMGTESPEGTELDVSEIGNALGWTNDDSETDMWSDS